MKAKLETLIDSAGLYRNQLIIGLSGSAKTYTVAKMYAQNKQPVLYVAPNMLQATNVVEDLRTFLPDEPIFLYPSEESVVAHFAASSSDFLAQKIEALVHLSSQQPGIVVATTYGLRQLLTPLDLFKQHRIDLAVDDEYSLETLVNDLVTMGYTRENLVESPGQFSVRGGIVDVYTLFDELPIRMEFFDTLVDSIRYFNPQTQSSTQQLEQCTILPVTDYLVRTDFMQQQSQAILSTVQKSIQTLEEDVLKNQITIFFTNLYERLAKGERIERLDRYSYFFYEPVSLIDYLSKDGLLILDEYARIVEVNKKDKDDEADYIVRKVQEAVALPNKLLLNDVVDTLKHAKQSRLYLSHMQKGLGRVALDNVTTFNYHGMPRFFSQMPLIKTEMDRFNKQQMTVVVCVSDNERVQKVSQTFADFHIEHVTGHLDHLVKGTVNIVVATIHSGFELVDEKLVFLNERELFNKVNRPVAKRQNLSNAERIQSYSQLQPGDYIVHTSHGIGRFLGMETMTINGVTQDYMHIIYQNNAKLFIPVTQLDMIQRYVAGEGKEPKLNKLGGTEWAKTKQKVSQKIEDIADELIALYAERESQKGHAFSPDTQEQAQFEDAFVYVETPDQLRSSAEIKKDMESIKPMDRLLVADVGYGKTEVAMRAAFKAVQDGKQVAFLVPTTILAQQHFATLTQRFEDFPFVVEVLNRFKTKSEQESILQRLKQGSIDIIVGTHRLLSNDVQFSDLGLIVVDEEQRFGVKHKERLKQLKSLVDVLTLTATPIPRTLHMSMLGIRDLSVIETPPANRFPVQTYVMEYNDAVVRDGIERELARGGQVFYLHNRVDDIGHVVDKIQQLVPQARVTYAHGQMSEVQLEQVLLDFMQGEYDVLVTTTIIETGVDLPNVNTLYVENADRMGLSTLYQLRGRVGRTNRIAYAYFMYDGNKSLNEQAEKRLETIKEFTQLGAGFKIAMRDLSIRGAGNLLGQQQSGFIDSVGFDLYTKMLKEAIVTKQTGKPVEEKTVEIDLGITAYIPSTYVSDERQKIDLYKRIREIDSIETYRQIQTDLIDRFGDYPDEVADLVAIGLLQHLAKLDDVESIKRVNQSVFVTFSREKSKTLTGAALFKQLARTRLKATIQNRKDQTVIAFDVTQLPSYAIIEELHKYLTVGEWG